MKKHFHFCVLVLVGILILTLRPAFADDRDNGKDDSTRLTVDEENDKFDFEHQDRHYTQGIRVGLLFGAVKRDSGWNKPYEWLSDNLPIFEGGDFKRKYDWNIGQSIFTPTNILTLNPSPKDRP